MPPLLSRLLSLLLAALLPVAGWYWLGQPVELKEPAIDGQLSCLSYTPFRGNESPFDLDTGLAIKPEHIEEDLRLLADHTACIRLYATDGMEQVPAIAKQIGLKVLMGGWVSSDSRATRHEMAKLVELANAYPETIIGVMVGNEALLRREIDADALAALIREVKGKVQQPVSYADVWEFQLRHPQVGEASDFVTIHILPYWEDQPVAIDHAIDHVRTIRQQVVERFPGKRILIGESGWPSVGRMREGALPSLVNEARFLRGFVAAAHAEGWEYNLIEAFDQPWKRQLEGAVGGYWGIFDTARHDKGLYSGAVSNHPQWPLFAAVAAALAMLLVITLRLAPLFAPLVALAAFGWSLQLEQLLLIARNSLEWGGAIVLLVVALATVAAALRRLAGRPMSPRIEAGSVLLLGAIAAILALWLLFDPRYRDFFTAALAVPALLMFLLIRSQPPAVRGGREELTLGLLLIVAAPLIATQETWQNHQALAWSATLLLLGSALLLRGRGALSAAPPAAPQ